MVLALPSTTHTIRITIRGPSVKNTIHQRADLRNIPVGPVSRSFKKSKLPKLAFCRSKGTANACCVRPAVEETAPLLPSLSCGIVDGISVTGDGVEALTEAAVFMGRVFVQQSTASESEESNSNILVITPGTPCTRASDVEARLCLTTM